MGEFDKYEWANAVTNWLAKYLRPDLTFKEKVDLEHVLRYVWLVTRREEGLRGWVDRSKKDKEANPETIRNLEKLLGTFYAEAGLIPAAKPASVGAVQVEADEPVVK